MNNYTHSNSSLGKSLAVLTLIAALAIGCAPNSDTSSSEAPTELTIGASDAPAGETASVELAAFESPEAGATALVSAIRDRDRETLVTIFGPGLDQAVPEGSVDDKDVASFLAAFDKTHRLITDIPGIAVLGVGEEEWTFPVPLVQEGDAWHFDLEAGADEMRARRIGRNELSTMQAALAYCDAQRDYASADRNGDGMLEYAQRFVSTDGKHDGLYWPAAEGQEQSPLGPAFEDAVGKGSYHGYRYRILTSQGKNAPGGAFNYVLGGRMSGGFGLIAWPLEYGESGIKSFIVSFDGKLFEKDLGAESETAAQAITSFDPDASWSAVKPGV